MVPELDARSKALRRYRRNIRQKELFLPLGPKVGPFFDILYSTTSDRDFLLLVRDHLLSIEYSAWFDFLKGISAACKQYGTLVTLSWKDFVNLELALGYFETNTTEPLLQRVIDWVGPRPRKLKDEEDFLTLFRSQAAALFSKLTFKKGSIRGFCKNRNMWATSGGSQDVGLKYDSGNVYTKSKWAYAFSLTDDDIYNLLFERRRGHAVVSSVEGAGKDRIIISSDNALHIKMSYLNSIMEQPIKRLFSSLRLSSLFYSSGDTAKMYLDMMSECDQTTTLKVPIDQSSFDQNQPKTHILILLDELSKRMSDPIDGLILDLVKESIDTSTVRVGKTVLPYSYGLLSGWRWTALLGTLCNIVSLSAICKMTEVTASYTCQGDDVSLVVKSRDDLLRILSSYGSLGYEVNPNKFWISTYRNEFLRRIVTSSGVDGYPSRSILSILWKKPQGSFLPKTLPEELEAVLQNWSAFLGRSGIKDINRGFKLGMWEDLVGAVSGRIPTDKLKNWLFTARTLGGGGLACLGHTALRVRRSVRDDQFTGYRRDSVLDSRAQAKYVHSRLWGRRAEYRSDTEVKEVDSGSLKDISLFSFFRELELVPVEALLRAGVSPLSIYIKPELEIGDEEVFQLEETTRTSFSIHSYDKVIRGYYGGTGTAVLDHLRRVGSVRVLKDYLLGEMKMNTPTVIGANPVILSTVKNYVENRFQKYLLTRKRVRFDWVKSALVLSEEVIRNIYNRIGNQVGTFVA